MMPKSLGLLSIPIVNGYELVEINLIEYFESDNKITTVYLATGNKIIAVKNIGYFENELKNQPFLRVHTSCIINLSRVKSYSKQDGGYFTLLSKKTIPVARDRKNEVLKFLRQIEDRETTEGKNIDIAWLIVNDTGREPQVFPLLKGKQLVGRKNTTKPCDIMIITEDKFMSRNHFFVEVREVSQGDYIFVASLNGSLNKTFIDLIEMKEGIEYQLKNGSIIRAGETKIQFKLASSASDNAENTILLIGK